MIHLACLLGLHLLVLRGQHLVLVQDWLYVSLIGDLEAGNALDDHIAFILVAESVFFARRRGGEHWIAFIQELMTIGILDNGPYLVELTESCSRRMDIERAP